MMTHKTHKNCLFYFFTVKTTECYVVYQVIWLHQLIRLMGCSQHHVQIHFVAGPWKVFLQQIKTVFLNSTWQNKILFWFNMLKQNICFLKKLFSEFDSLLLKTKRIVWINNVKKNYLWIAIFIFILQNILKT